jgi:flagellar biosynthetic protein FlhB
MAENDDTEKTEEPTSRRIEEAVKKGQIAFSREVTNFFMFVTLALILVWLLPAMARPAINFLERFIANPHDIDLNQENFDEFFSDIIKNIIIIFSIPILITLFAAFVSSLIQNGIVYSVEPLIPKLEKISLIKGIKKMFSMRSFVEFAKGILKIIAIGYITYLIFDIYKPEILASTEVSLNGIMDGFMHLAFLIILGACILMMLVAIVDFLYQKYEYMKSLKMSKKELKEEYKQTEGNPEIKAKLRQIRQKRARKRMMAAVPKADVVIRNPTHYAVALAYEQNVMSAPKVVAIGQDLIALNIIKIAEENDITVVTNRNLAKALYETAELDEEIPLEHYKAVAEVIAYVYNLKNKKFA